MVHQDKGSVYEYDHYYDEELEEVQRTARWVAFTRNLKWSFFALVVLATIAGIIWHYELWEIVL